MKIIDTALMIYTIILITIWLLFILSLFIKTNKKTEKINKFFEFALPITLGLFPLFFMIGMLLTSSFGG